MNLQELKQKLHQLYLSSSMTSGTMDELDKALDTLIFVHKQLDGLEWSADTPQAIADGLRTLGLHIREPGVVFDHRIARDEGWDMEAHNGVWNLVRVDEDVFGSDIDALIWVAKGADGGSDFHRDALELIGKLAEV